MLVCLERLAETLMRSTKALPLCLGLLVFGCATGGEDGTVSHARAETGAGGESEAGDDTSAGGGGSSGAGGADGGQGGSLPEGGSDVVIDTTPPPDGPVCDAAAVINEIQADGTTDPDDEFIELYNGGTCAVAMDDFTLYYRSATSTADVALWTAAGGQTLKPGTFFVIGGPKYSYGAPDYPMQTGVLSSSGGGLALRRGLKMIDMVGWGTSMNFVDGYAAPAPVAGGTIGRHPDGNDTDNNSMDFAKGPPTPRKPNQNQ
jgi:hypothetical protein